MHDRLDSRALDSVVSQLLGQGTTDRWWLDTATNYKKSKEIHPFTCSEVVVVVLSMTKPLDGSIAHISLLIYSTLNL